MTHPKGAYDWTEGSGRQEHKKVWLWALGRGNYDSPWSSWTSSLSYRFWFQELRMSQCIAKAMLSWLPSGQLSSNRKRRCQMRKALEMKAVSSRKKHGHEDTPRMIQQQAKRKGINRSSFPMIQAQRAFPLEPPISSARRLASLQRFGM